jgi:hypothetical protein
MPDTSDIAVSVVARDADGNEVSVSTVVAIRRPDRCGAASDGGTEPSAGSDQTSPDGGTPPDDSTSTTSGGGADGSVPPPTPGDQGDSVVVDAVLGASEIWATGDGLCGAGATTVVVEARMAAGGVEVDGVVARVTLATGSDAGTVQLASQGGGVWRASIGPIAADRNMPASSVLTVRVTARRGERSASDTVTLNLRRPTPCASVSTAAPDSTVASAPAATVATVPAAPVTASPTTSVAPAPPVALTIDGRAGATTIVALADGLCAPGPTTISVEAITSGPANEVQVRAIGANGSTLATVSLADQGGGIWRSTLGPIAGNRDMPATSSLTLQFGARGPGGSPTSSDSVTISLVRPVPCA